MLGIEDELVQVEGDLTDADAVSRVLAEHRVDTVFHLAAETIVGTVQASPVRGFESNVRGTWTVLEACREREVERVVVASSDKAYGAHDELPYREDFALRPTAPYEASKAAADLIARSYWHSYGLPVAVTRFANIYGGGDLNFSRLIPEAVSAAIDGRAPVLRSDGSPERDFLYVEDAAAAYLAIADEPRPRRGPRRGLQRRRRAAHAVGDVVAMIAGWPAPGRARDPRAPATRRARSTASTSTRRSSASASAGSPRSSSRRACAGRSSGTGRTRRLARRGERPGGSARSAALQLLLASLQPLLPGLGALLRDRLPGLELGGARRPELRRHHDDRDRDDHDRDRKRADELSAVRAEALHLSR